MHFGPNGPEAPEDGTIIRVTGHFDDAASAECEIAQGEPDPQLVDQVQSELYCSTQFVVEGYEVLGTHPNWPWS